MSRDRGGERDGPGRINTNNNSNNNSRNNNNSNNNNSRKGGGGNGGPSQRDVGSTPVKATIDRTHDDVIDIEHDDEEEALQASMGNNSNDSDRGNNNNKNNNNINQRDTESSSSPNAPPQPDRQNRVAQWKRNAASSSPIAVSINSGKNSAVAPSSFIPGVNASLPSPSPRPRGYDDNDGDNNGQSNSNLNRNESNFINSSRPSANNIANEQSRGRDRERGGNGNNGGGNKPSSRANNANQSAPPLNTPSRSPNDDAQPSNEGNDRSSREQQAKEREQQDRIERSKERAKDNNSNEGENNNNRNGWMFDDTMNGTIVSTAIIDDTSSGGRSDDSNRNGDGEGYRTCDDNTTAGVDALKAHGDEGETHHHVKLSEFAEEMEEKYGKPSYGFARLAPIRNPYFNHHTLIHFLHRPQLKQFFKDGQTILVRENTERKAKWNELFFDLIFIVVFERIAHELRASLLDGQSLTRFGVLFCAAWKIWFDLTSYIDQYDPTDTLHKVYFMAQMVFVMGLAVETVKGVVGSYLAGTGVTLMLRLWGAYYSPRARQDAYAQTFIYFLAAIPWLASLAYSSPVTDSDGNIGSDFAHYQLWAVGLFIAFTGQAIAQWHPRFHIPLNTEHTAERFGIFTILCMGEQVLNLLFADTEASKSSYMMSVLGGVMIFAVQILYYDIDGFQHKMHALRGGRLRGHVWALLHMPFQGCIVVSSVTFRFYISSSLHSVDHRASADAYTEAAVALMDGTLNATAEEMVTLANAAIAEMIEAASHETDKVTVILAAHRQLFCVANGGLLFTLFLIALLHVGRDGHVIRRRWRMIARASGTIAMFFLHLTGTRMSPLAMMAYAGFFFGIIACLDIYGGFVPVIPKGHVGYVEPEENEESKSEITKVEDYSEPSVIY